MCTATRIPGKDHSTYRTESDRSWTSENSDSVGLENGGACEVAVTGVLRLDTADQGPLADEAMVWLAYCALEPTTAMMKSLMDSSSVKSKPSIPWDEGGH